MTASVPKFAKFAVVAFVCFGLAHLVSSMLVSWWTPAFLISHQTRNSVSLLLTVVLGSYLLYATGKTRYGNLKLFTN